MYEMDLALNNLQWLICHKTEQNQTKLKSSRFYFSNLALCLTWEGAKKFLSHQETLFFL